MYAQTDDVDCVSEKGINMVFDYKKEYKEYYLPPKKPTIVEVPKMNYLAVRGKGNPNQVDGEYSKAISALYAIAYTLKMSDKGDYKIDGFFEYVVPPLEGFWWQENLHGYDSSRKDDFCWISLIRLPDFISEKDVEWAKETAKMKKKQDYSMVEFFTHEEGLCVQCMHIGSYDSEIETVNQMKQYMGEQGYVEDFSEHRYHHEIYLSDPRKTAMEKWKTVVRHPICKK